MPDSSTSPSQSIIDRILGRSPSDPEFDARMNLAKQKMQQEMPNEMGQASIEPTGLFGSMKDALVKRVIGGTPVATTSPFGSITYNKEQLAPMSQNELEDTLAHELTHVGQYAQQPMWKNLMQSVMPQQNEGLPAETSKALRMQGWDPAYRGRAAEMEAYGTEQQRQLNTQRGFPGYDIQLTSPAKKKSITSPSSKVLEGVK
jgi:hypothetical protein